MNCSLILVVSASITDYSDVYLHVTVLNRDFEKKEADTSLCVHTLTDETVIGTIMKRSDHFNLKDVIG